MSRKRYTPGSSGISPGLGRYDDGSATPSLYEAEAALSHSCDRVTSPPLRIRGDCHDQVTVVEPPLTVTVLLGLPVGRMDARPSLPRRSSAALLKGI